MEVMMLRTLTLAAIVLGSVALSVPVYAAEQGGEAGGGFNRAETNPVVSGLPSLTRPGQIGFRTATASTVIVIGQMVSASRPRLALVTD
jgi:hypothetical protein